MILVRKKVVREWLKLIGRNQAWLALYMGYTQGYVSQIMNNRCKMSSAFIEDLLRVTHMSFEDLFATNGEPDAREFYGEVFVLNGETMNKRKYYEAIRQRETHSENTLWNGAQKKDFTVKNKIPYKKLVR